MEENREKHNKENKEEHTKIVFKHLGAKLGINMCITSIVQEK